jgi:hypothetical protein
MSQSKEVHCVRILKIPTILLCLTLSGSYQSSHAQTLESLSPQQLEVLTRDRLAVLADFDGVWEGNLSVKAARGVADHKWQQFDLRTRITIRGLESSVAIFDNGEWKDLKGYQFQTVRNKTNAVVTTIVSQEGAQWVETWNFSLTQLEADTLFAVSNRMVNNFLMAKNEDFARAVFVGQGEMRRTGRVPKQGTAL